MSHGGQGQGESVPRSLPALVPSTPVSKARGQAAATGLRDTRAPSWVPALSRDGDRSGHCPLGSRGHRVPWPGVTPPTPGMRWPQGSPNQGEMRGTRCACPCPQRPPGTWSITGGTRVCPHAHGEGTAPHACPHTGTSSRDGVTGRRPPLPHTHTEMRGGHTSPYSPGVPKCVPTSSPRTSVSPAQLPCPHRSCPHCRCPHAPTAPRGSTCPSPHPHVPTWAGHPVCQPQPLLSVPETRRARAQVPTRVALSVSPHGGRWRPGVAAGSAAGEYFWSAVRSFQSCDEDII